MNFLHKLRNAGSRQCRSISIFMGLFISIFANSNALAGSITLKQLVVPESVTAGKGYQVEIPYTATGKVRVISVSYYWDSEGPFTYRPNGDNTRLKNRLRTGNPRTYKLSAIVNYSSDGALKKTNRVSATLRVNP